MSPLLGARRMRRPVIADDAVGGCYKPGVGGMLSCAPAAEITGAGRVSKPHGTLIGQLQTADQTGRWKSIVGRNGATASTISTSDRRRRVLSLVRNTH